MIQRWNSTLWTGLAAFGIAGAFYWLTGDLRFDWADEGFLWYGALHTRLGEVPFRDFQSQDPARSYWSAALSYVFGEGLLALRWSCSLFQGLCLWAGLLALKSAIRSFIALVTAGVLSALWMFWSFRYFDAGIPLVVMYAATRLLEKPNGKRHFQAGLMLGLIFLFARNHALYAGVSMGCLSLYGAWKKWTDRPFQAVLCLVLGALIGASPLLWISLRFPGFWEAYLESFAGSWTLLLDYFKLNIAGGGSGTQGILWPWSLSWGEVTREVSGTPWKMLRFSNLWAQGAALATMPLLFAAILIWVLSFSREKIRNHALLIGSAFVGAAYCHPVLTRSDVTHLGEGIFPLLAALWALNHYFSRQGKRALGLAFSAWAVLLTLAAALPLNPIFFKLNTPKENLRHYPVGQDKIWMRSYDAEFLESVQRFVRENLGPGETLLMAPIFTTFYCVLGKSSPVWEIYFYLPQPVSVQERMVRQLEEKKLRWALVGDLAMDGFLDRRFSVTHAVLWDYFKRHYESVPVHGIPAGYHLFRRTSTES